MRVAVIGAGIIGTCVAWRLTRASPSVEVTVIDHMQPGQGVTGSSFAWVTASRHPKPADYLVFNLAGVDEYDRLSAEFGRPEWIGEGGHLQWYHAHDQDSARDLVATMRAHDYKAELLDRSGVAALEPNVEPGAATEFAYFPREKWIDAPTMCRVLLEQVAAHPRSQVQLGRAVTGIIRRGNGFELEFADLSRLEVDAVVNAAGPNGDHIARLVGRTLPLVDEPGLVIRLQPEVPSLVRRAMHSPDVEIRPDSHGRILLHSRRVDALLGSDGLVRTDQVTDLHRLGAEVVPALAGSRVCDARVGWRALPLGEMPSLGRVDDSSSYFEAISHNGVSLAPLIGRVLSEEILSGVRSDLTAPYRPDRFAA